MKITILVDNNHLRDDLEVKQAFSAIIEDEDKKFLFDTGMQGEVIGNADKLGVDLSNLDYLVFSHGHSDHTGGSRNVLIPYLNRTKKPKILACSGFFNQRRKIYPTIEEIGSNDLETFMKTNFEVILMEQPHRLTNNLIFLGKIERTIDFEGKNSLGEVKMPSGEYVDDYIDDDTAMAYDSKHGLIVISPCAHSGICNTVKYAQKIMGKNKMTDVIAGTHLKDASNELIEKTIETLRKMGVNRAHFCHCTGKAMGHIKTLMNCENTGSGLVLEY
ncbi:MAG: MBL fold metallo-hydrolase [Rickettsiales bacterium]|jgi:7,8-dihydropterin-6-yl-methyl-4-(beta-D-ribofuranosyl)aminobenzene 5'-phosphate synthase|nr:MBL fold metallo-hydrolase [Rickettsiales bacterium]